MSPLTLVCSCLLVGYLLVQTLLGWFFKRSELKYGASLTAATPVCQVKAAGRCVPSFVAGRGSCAIVEEIEIDPPFIYAISSRHIKTPSAPSFRKTPFTPSPAVNITVPSNPSPMPYVTSFLARPSIPSVTFPSSLLTTTTTGATTLTAATSSSVLVLNTEEGVFATDITAEVVAAFFDELEREEEKKELQKIKKH
ncbi:hypothetical protein BD770DRAFT_409184 [Pilaira anomala]|nr:hypothetical protein BD770DRAFT_409184 [Pilaira anomala]